MKVRIIAKQGEVVDLSLLLAKLLVDHGLAVYADKSEERPKRPRTR